MSVGDDSGIAGWFTYQDVCGEDRVMFRIWEALGLSAVSAGIASKARATLGLGLGQSARDAAIHQPTYVAAGVVRWVSLCWPDRVLATRSSLTIGRARV
jgi:hypothetical protein